MYSNCRTIIEREEKWRLKIIIEVRNKSYEGEISLKLPGRRVEEFESLVDALSREVREETGLEI